MTTEKFEKIRSYICVTICQIVFSRIYSLPVCHTNCHKSRLRPVEKLIDAVESDSDFPKQKSEIYPPNLPKAQCPSPCSASPTTSLYQAEKLSQLTRVTDVQNRIKESDSFIFPHSRATQIKSIRFSGASYFAVAQILFVAEREKDQLDFIAASLSQIPKS